ncbi:MAG: hypothetical protein IKB74_04075 [Lentisphaeria bacterium]|nr:hypothetical protein [Lentisphaeria bacterium]
MKISKLLAFALIAAGLCTLSAAEKDKKFKITANIEDIRAAQTFAVNYTLSQETVKAQFAKGNPEGTLLPEGIPMRFDFDVLSTTNYGLHIGPKRACVRYDGKGNFPLKAVLLS